MLLRIVSLIVPVAGTNVSEILSPAMPAVVASTLIMTPSTSQFVEEATAGSPPVKVPDGKAPNGLPILTVVSINSEFMVGDRPRLSNSVIRSLIEILVLFVVSKIVRIVATVVSDTEKATSWEASTRSST